MTDILCRWLNDELEVSLKVEQPTFARDFATGYLIGEVLNKYQLQNDFEQFSQTKTSDAKLNNFTRVEPVLHLLGIPFDTNLARDVMTEKHGVATRLMYQLYIALNNKKKANLTGVAMETMRPAAPAKLNAVESGIYRERLKHMTPRQTDLNLESLVSRFHEKQIEMEKTAFRERFYEQERLYQKRQEERQKMMDRSRELRTQQTEMVAKLHAATVHIPMPPPVKTVQALQRKKETRRKRFAQETIESISEFEEKMKMTLPPSKLGDEDEGIDIEYIMSRDEEKSILDTVDLIKPASNDDYIYKIRKRLQEDESARSEREKRRRKVLVDQMKAHEFQEEARREEMLVNRLMRQSQQERRIAVQLLQTRHEKEVIRRNRIMREKQYEERRLKDFEDALNKEAEMARLARLEYEEQNKKDQELHDKIAAERAEEKYRNHYDLSMEVVNQVVDFSAKVAEYRELTNNLLPAKLMREWKALFVAGQPLYEQAAEIESTEPTPEQILEAERQRLLDEGDFMEYKNMVGEWQPPEGCEVAGPPRDNPVVGHIVQRLFNMVHPPSPPPPPPEFPPFPVRACVLGKVFSGVTSCVKKLAEEHRLEVLSVDDAVNEAVEAHKRGEILEIVPEPEVEEKAAADSMTEPSADSVPEVNVRCPTGEGMADEPPNSPEKPAIEEVEQTAGETPTGVTAEGAKPEEEKQGEATPTEPPAEESKPPSPQKRPSRKGKEKEKVVKPQASPRAKLGSKAQKFLKKGQPIEEQLIVDILVEAIRRIPEGTGWLLDGFPANYSQAKLLEKALSGFDAAGQETAKEKDKPKAEKGKMRKSNLVPDPRPPPPPKEPASGIDVVITFDIADEVCLKRAAGRTKAVLAEEQYHQEFEPPPEGSATGIGKTEQVVPVEDPAHDQEQLQHRITAFHDAWPKLEKWFTRFGSLQRVDATQERQVLYLEVEKILEDTVAKIQGKDEQSSAPVEVTQTQPTPKTEEKPATPVVPAEPPKEAAVESPRSRKGSRAGSAKKSGSRPSSKESRSKSPKSSAKGDKKGKAESPKRSGSSSGKGSAKKASRGASPKSPKRGKGSGKKKTPEPEPEPEPVVDTGPPPPEPGSEEWDFVDQDVEMDLADVLAKHWEAVEETYVDNNKKMFRKVRDERENIYRYFYQIKKDYLAYLRRPDHKQEFLAQWQKDYNDVSDDMREDEETRAELHQRVDDLKERLWNICDERKEQAEKERETIMNDGWVDDRMGVLSNYYITLMQGEVDRFQDTVRLLKDYYRGMEGHIPDELNVNYARIPLIELPVERPDSPDKPASGASTPQPTSESPGSAKSGDRPRSKSPKDRAKSPKERAKSPKESRSKSPKERSKSPKDRAKSRTPSGKRRDKSKEKKEEKPPEQPVVAEGGRRIPLVPRRPVSPEPDAKAGAGAGKDKKDKKGAKKGAPAGGEDAAGAESPQPPQDPDEKLLFDAFHTGITAIGSIVSVEQAAKEAEEEAEKQKEMEKEKEKAAAANKKGGGKEKGGKKGKSRSPSPKKGGKKEADAAPTPPPPSVELSEEEKQKKDARDKMKQEYYFAIQEEETATKTRLEVIKAHSMSILQDLKGKADNGFKDMNDWLGARFLKEMESIDQMSEIVRNAIENRQKVKQELVLVQQDFVLDEEYRVLRTPTPPPPPPAVEQPMMEQFTVDQLMSLYQQFVATAPTGVMSSKSFTETFENMVAVTHGLEQLPDIWMTITPGQVQEIATGLSSDAEYVDWRRLLLALAQPIPTPTQTDLLETLQNFKEMDQKNTGFVTREQYERMDLWFSSGQPSDTGYDRLTNLKIALFDIFADHSRTPVVLDYVGMLMYFSAADDATEGLLRALTVASGTHMPRIHRPVQRMTSIGGSTPDIPEEPSSPTPAPPPIPEDIPPEAIDATVPLEALYQVFHHGESAKGDSHRFSVSADPEDATSRERLAAVYVELGCENQEPVPYRVLIEHPLIQDIVGSCQTFKALDLRGILTNINPEVESHSNKTID